MKNFVFTLTDENINHYISLVKELGTKYRAESQRLAESLIALEEIMLYYKAQFGEDKEIRLKIKKRFGNFTCIISLSGKCLNPFDNNESEDKNTVLDLLGLTPHYTYYLGVNQITINLHINQGRKEFRTILISFVLGIVIGLLGHFIPESIMKTCIALVEALSKSIFGIMTMIALPVVFLCLIYGILGSGTVHNFKQNGVRIMRNICFLCFLCLLLFPPFR